MEKFILKSLAVGAILILLVLSIAYIVSVQSDKLAEQSIEFMLTD